MSDSVDISVIVPTYNRNEMLRDALADLIVQEVRDVAFTFEIIVVDDASTDLTKPTVEALSQTAPRTIRYVPGPGKGYTHALNAGLGAASGRWLAFFDDDQRAESGWLASLLEAAESTKSEIVGGRIELRLPRGREEELGNVGRAIYGEYPPKRSYRAKDTGSLLPPGGNRLVKSALFDRVGRFDESFLTGGCDLEFVLRAQRNGAAYAFSADALVYHEIPPERLVSNVVARYGRQAGYGKARAEAKNFNRGRIALQVLRSLLVVIPANALIFAFEAVRGSDTGMMDCRARHSLHRGYLAGVWQIATKDTGLKPESRSAATFRDLRD